MDREPASPAGSGRPPQPGSDPPAPGLRDAGAGAEVLQKDRSAAIRWRRAYSLHQVAYGRHFILRRNFPIHKIFERCGELGLCRLTADQIIPILGVRQHRRLRGWLHRMREKLDHGHPVRRLYGKSLVARRYEKLAICSDWRSASIG